VESALDAGNSYALQQQRYRARRQQHVAQVLARERRVLRRQVGQVGEWRIGPRGVEDPSPHLKRERSATHEIAGHRQRERCEQHRPASGRRQSAPLRRDDVHPRPRMREDLVDPARTEQQIERATENARHLRRGRPARVALLVDVRVVPTRERRHRVTLRETRHAPAADRRPDQMERAPAWLLQELAKQVAIEPREHEPLRAAGRAGDDIDVFGAEPTVANEAQRVGPGAQRERRRRHRPASYSPSGTGRRLTRRAIAPAPRSNVRVRRIDLSTTLTPLTPLTPP
jgi:hypothetical protein